MVKGIRKKMQQMSRRELPEKSQVIRFGTTVGSGKYTGSFATNTKQIY